MEKEIDINGNEIAQQDELGAVKRRLVKKPKIQVITFQVSTAGQRININDWVDQDYSVVTGLLINSINLTSLNKSTLELTIDKEEIFPKDFDCFLITQKSTVGLYSSLYKVNERGKGSIIKGVYEDGSDTLATPYIVKLYLFCEMHKWE